LVQALVDVERASVDLAEQDVDVADEEFPGGKSTSVCCRRSSRRIGRTSPGRPGRRAGDGSPRARPGSR
jgi:hypothetical protein